MRRYIIPVSGLWKPKRRERVVGEMYFLTVTGSEPLNSSASDIPILYDDGDLIAVNKPEGLAVIAERRPDAPCLLHLLQHRLSRRLFVVHRIDKDAGGLVIFAGSAESHRHLCLQFQNRKVRKTYRVLVHGIVHEERGTIDAPLRQFGSGRVGVDPQRGKASVTRYRAIRRLVDSTLLEACPVTGRRHQIRVHLYSIGHPIVGDRGYGDVAVQRRYSRLMLHAREAEFSALNGEVLHIGAPEPESFRALVQQASAGRLLD